MYDLFEKYEAGHAYVDLGLSVNWATLNVGQFNIFDFGDRFAWGDNRPQLDNYQRWEEYKHLHPKSHPLFSKYNTDPEYGIVDNLTRLEPEDDVATTRWGWRWRMPTAKEFEELIDNCSCKWIFRSEEHTSELIDNCSCKWIFYQKDEHDVTDGFLFTSKVEGYEGNSIFLPGCGIIYDHSGDESQEHYEDKYFYGDCFYWSSDLVGGGPSSTDCACMFFADKSPLGSPRVSLKQAKRYIVTQIRPVFS